MYSYTIPAAPDIVVSRHDEMAEYIPLNFLGAAYTAMTASQTATLSPTQRIPRKQ
jgi:hypothetical protein